MANLYAIDVETSCPYKCSVKCKHALDVFICEFNGMGVYSQNLNRKEYFTKVEEIKAFFTNSPPDNKYICHHGKFDQQVIYNKTGIWFKQRFDTRLAASLMPHKTTSLRLEDLCVNYLHLPPWKDKSFLATIDTQDPQDVADYCLIDCVNTQKLADYLHERLKEYDLLNFLFDYLMPLSELTAKMEYRGVHVDAEEIKLLIETTTQKIVELTDKASALVSDDIKAVEKETGKTFSFNSVPQLRSLLINKLKVNPKDHTGKVSVAKKALERCKNQHPFIPLLLDVRTSKSHLTQYKKWYSLTKDRPTIHTHYNLDITRTGRLSSSDPINLQNIQRGQVRRVFVAKPGFILFTIDYSQIEPRVLAHESRDPALLAAFNSGEDFYATLMKGFLNLEQTPKQIKEDLPHIRNIGKTTGLSACYGIGAPKLSADLTYSLDKKVGYNKAYDLLRNFNDKFKGIGALRIRLNEEYKTHGYIKNMFGRIVSVNSDKIYHTIINSLIQSTASDLACKAQLNMEKACEENNIDADPVLLVHDEGVWQVRKEHADRFRERIDETMVEPFKLRVPIKVDIFEGNNWASKV